MGTALWAEVAVLSGAGFDRRNNVTADRPLEAFIRRKRRGVEGGRMDFSAAFAVAVSQWRQKPARLILNGFAETAALQ